MMSVVISSNYVLSDSISGGGVINADNPLIGYDNIVTSGVLASTTAQAGYPVTNLANPATHLQWRGNDNDSDEYIYVNRETTDPIDYVGIAKHNLGTSGMAVSVEVSNGGSPEVWTEVFEPVLLATDAPAILRFAPQAVFALRVRIQPSASSPAPFPRVAVLYVGKLLVLQRRIYVGHTPITMGRVTTVVNGRSESGNFLGRIVLGETTQTKVELQNLTPDWYRSYMEPFLLQAQENPFFFAWRPGTYVREVGYAWLTTDPIPSNQRSNGMMQVSLEMAGIR